MPPPTIHQILLQSPSSCSLFHYCILLQHLFIILQSFLDVSWIQTLPLFLCPFQLCLQVLQSYLIFLLLLYELLSFCLCCLSSKLFRLKQRHNLQIYQFQICHNIFLILIFFSQCLHLTIQSFLLFLMRKQCFYPLHLCGFPDFNLLP